MEYFVFFFAVIATFDFASAQEGEAFLPQSMPEFGVQLNDGKNYSGVDHLDVNSKLWRKFMTKGGFNIGVYDNVLTTAQCEMLMGLITFKLGAWNYRISEADVYGGQKHTSPNDIPWYNEINSEEFFQTMVGKQLQKVVMNLAGGDEIYFPFKVTGHILRRGDYPKVHIDSRAEENEISMMVYLNSKWRKNDYGDLYLYDDDKEIVAGVVPRYGRIVAWQSSVPYLPRPPSVAFKFGQTFLHIRFTKNQTKFIKVHKQWLDDEKLKEAVQNSGFFLTAEEGKTAHEKDVASQMVSKFKSKDGKYIVVFDDIFSVDVLDHLRSLILNHGVYYYDDSYDEESDNVHWIAGFSVDKYIESKMWKVTRQLAKFVSDGHSDWFPYDVSCNLNRNADTTQIHHDCESDEDEWTFLLYLNPHWDINYYGETVFYEKNDDKSEIIAEVLPKYGRVVIFQGIIPHSARPPSTNFSGARLSFAVKLSKNEWLGRKKEFQEGFRHLSAITSMLTTRKYEKWGNDGVNDDTANQAKEDEDGSEEGPDVDPALTRAPDEALEMERRFETIIEGNSLEELRALAREVHKRRHDAREHVGELLRQFL